MSLRFERFASASFRDFEDVVELYRSNSGAVYCGKYKFDNIIYVLKEKKVSELGKKKDVMNEVRLLAQLCHPNVITCEGWFNDSERMSMFIILEYCPGGDLSKKVDLRRKSRKFFSEEYIWFLFHQMVLGVQHLHINGIIHRDLKLLNVVLSKKDTVVKIADLGVSRQVSRNTAMLDTFIGTPLYLSPELVDNKPYNEKTDIWSLGVILYELCALTPPFRGHNVLALSNMIRAGRYEPLPGIYSTDMEKCVQWLLNVNYLQRPTINQLLEFVEKHISPSYHGEDMAAEWDMNNHSVSKLVVIPGSPDRNKQIVDRAPIDKCFEGQAEDSSEEVDEGDSLEDNDQSGHEELHDRKKHRHHRRHRRHSRRRHSHSSDDDISDVSEDSLDRKKKPHRKHRSHSKDRGRGRESDADQLEKSHRDRSKSRQKYHNAESEPEERYKRGKRPHTSSHGNRKESEYDRPPAGSGVNAARKGKKKSHVHPNQESVPTPKNPSSTLIQFEVSRLQMLLKREASQLTRLVKLKDFFLLNSTIENEKEVPVSKSAPNRPKTAPLPNEETNQSSAISGVDFKIKQCNERMAILKRGIQNNGALTREEIANIDSLKVLIAPIQKQQREEEEINAAKQALNDKKSENGRSGAPIKYKKLQGRHRSDAVNAGDDHINLRLDHNEDRDRLEQLRQHEYEGIVMPKNIKGVVPSIPNMEYSNPFEMDNNKEMFKAKNIEYSLFAHDTSMLSPKAAMRNAVKIHNSTINSRVAVDSDADTEDDEPHPGPNGSGAKAGVDANTKVDNEKPTKGKSHNDVRPVEATEISPKIVATPAPAHAVEVQLPPQTITITVTPNAPNANPKASPPIITDTNMKTAIPAAPNSPRKSPEATSDSLPPPLPATSANTNKPSRSVTIDVPVVELKEVPPEPEPAKPIDERFITSSRGAYTAINRENYQKPAFARKKQGHEFRRHLLNEEEIFEMNESIREMKVKDKVKDKDCSESKAVHSPSPNSPKKLGTPMKRFNIITGTYD